MGGVKSDSEVAAFFDLCARKKLMTDFPEDEQEKLETFESLWAIPEGGRLLEPGCGSGRLTARLAQLVGSTGQVYACDLSPGMLQLAAERHLPPQAQFACRSCFTLPHPDSWFDRILCVNVFPHFADPAQALREFHRLLKPDGRLWINHFEGRNSLNLFHHEAAPEVSDHALPCLYSMKRLMSETGFQIEKFQDTVDWYILGAMKHSLPE